MSDLKIVIFFKKLSFFNFILKTPKDVGSFLPFNNKDKSNKFVKFRENWIKNYVFTDHTKYQLKYKNFKTLKGQDWVKSSSIDLKIF